jgi:hypothetical protein
MGTFQERRKKHVYDTDSYFSTCSCWRTAYLAAQQELGILSQRRGWIDSFDFAHPAATGADLKSKAGRPPAKPEHHTEPEAEGTNEKKGG